MFIFRTFEAQLNILVIELLEISVILLDAIARFVYDLQPFRIRHLCFE
jgi:hypothetical protein